ncbi:MAG: chloride channel protein [Caulobacteraceae bacterium]
MSATETRRSFKTPLKTRERRKLRLRARRTTRLIVIVAGAIAASIAAVLFAKLCDLAQAGHSQILAASRPLALLLLPLSFAATVWLTRRFAPASAGSGIPQIIAAAESQRALRAPDARVSIWTASFKIAVCAFLLLCGASIGREGPTVQVAAALVYLFGARMNGGPGRRALLIAGGAAGVAAAFNTPIAGIVFAVEELARGFDRRSSTIIILVVVAAGAAAYAMSGNYAYFGELRGETKLGYAWYCAPVLGIICGVAGGLFSKALAGMIGPKPGRVGRWRLKRPVVFALGCGGVAALAALGSHGLTYGTGYAETSSLLAGHPGRGATLAVFKWIANLAAAGSGAPGGIFSPSLTAGAGIGSAFAHFVPLLSNRDAVVLGMAAYLAGVLQAPLTSAIILMEMTRDPGLVGPLMLATLIARAVSSQIMPEPIYHVLSHNWLRKAHPTSPPVAQGPADAVTHAS